MVVKIIGKIVGPKLDSFIIALPYSDSGLLSNTNPLTASTKLCQNHAVAVGIARTNKEERKGEEANIACS